MPRTAEFWDAHIRLTDSTSSANKLVLSFSHIMAEEPKKKFEPKNPVQLDAPKDDPISLEYLAKCDGTQQCCSQEDIIMLTMSNRIA